MYVYVHTHVCKYDTLITSLLSIIITSLNFFFHKNNDKYLRSFLSVQGHAYTHNMLANAKPNQDQSIFPQIHTLLFIIFKNKLQVFRTHTHTLSGSKSMNETSVK